MGRNRSKTDELMPLYIGYIRDTFFGNLKVAYRQMSVEQFPEANITLATFYAMMRGEDCTPIQVRTLEQCCITWAESHSDPKLKELRASATPPGGK